MTTQSAKNNRRRSSRGSISRRFSTGTHISRRRSSSVASAKLYKTEVCRTFSETGSCPYGNKCQFAHGVTEMRPVVIEANYKSEQCKNILLHGICPYGVRCRFIHDDDVKVKMPNSVEAVLSHPRPVAFAGLRSLEHGKESNPEPHLSGLSVSSYKSPDGFRCVFKVGDLTIPWEDVVLSLSKTTNKPAPVKDVPAAAVDTAETSPSSSGASEQTSPGGKVSSPSSRARAATVEDPMNFRWMPNPRPRRPGGMTSADQMSAEARRVERTKSFSRPSTLSALQENEVAGLSGVVAAQSGGNDVKVATASATPASTTTTGAVEGTGIVSTPSSSDPKRRFAGLVIHGELPHAIETGTFEPVRMVPALTVNNAPSVAPATSSGRATVPVRTKRFSTPGPFSPVAHIGMSTTLKLQSDLRSPSPRHEIFKNMDRDELVSIATEQDREIKALYAKLAEEQSRCRVLEQHVALAAASSPHVLGASHAPAIGSAQLYLDGPVQNHPRGGRRSMRGDSVERRNRIMGYYNQHVSARS